MKGQIYIDPAGRWSGGGQALLSNLEFAANRHSILQGDEKSRIWLVPRNVPARRSPTGIHNILVPQNAWPWRPYFNGGRELVRVSALRGLSEWHLQRAVAVLRISRAIPKRKPEPFSSPVIHNVIDIDFEQALEAARTLVVGPSIDALVSIGSMNSYRNLEALIDGYAEYQRHGGQRRLYIAGAPMGTLLPQRLHRAAASLHGVTIEPRALSRPECLAVMSQSAGVILPSLVEASPVTALEALAVSPRTAMSRIPGHMELMEQHGEASRDCFFDPRSRVELSNALARMDEGGTDSTPAAFGDSKAREISRERWSDRVAEWAEEIINQL